ncbi:T6SS immunity protein Tdi1 domain-containing protein [Agrococcus terreus]|uniref:GAD-related domain-containing protein n=1 Tax=Agrococcus terreus TaxID=574649 RepID=A0ABQ2KA23_9MICO|nr:T6SS immunity protein Tdi1 domain-containing protein [Agrococcus terreus]GGN77332.1 hypothetical protein GCM10010968_01750 [Agrococcus terreus]
MIPITDFVLHAPVPQTTIDAYRDRVHPEVVDLWETYGFGTFGYGFFRVIDPVAYERGIGDVLGKVIGQRISIPFLVTGLADVVTWEPGIGVGAIYRNGSASGVGTDLDTLLGMLALDGEDYLAEEFDWDMFPEAVAAHNPLAFDESFTYVPLLSLGGPKHVDNLKPRKTIEAIRTMVELQGVIEH